MSILLEILLVLASMGFGMVLAWWRMAPTTADLRASLDQQRLALAEAQKRAAEDIQNLQALLAQAIDEGFALRAQVAGSGIKLRQVEGQLAGARGRSMRKEKMASKAIAEISTSQTDELF